ncbi:MAG: hypothetical protein R2777_01365 [Chitinophagales bacterium]
MAKMAGMATEIVNRANEILKQLEQKHIDTDIAEKIKTYLPICNSVFDTTDEEAQKLKKQVQELDINTLTPVEALMKLNELKNGLK